MKIRFILLCLLAGTVLAACNEDNNRSASTSPAAVNLQAVASAGELEAYLKSGLKNISKQANYYMTDRMFVADVVMAPEASPSEGSVDGISTAPGVVRFSSTNVVEQGVDEADLLKFDGTDLYLIESYAAYQTTETPVEGASAMDSADNEPVSLRILRPDPLEASATELVRYNLPAEFFSVDRVEGMYLYEKGSKKQLSIVGEHYLRDNRPGIDMWGWCGMWSAGKTALYLLDVTNPVLIQPQLQVEIDGYLLQSRRIDNMLYIVTRYTPSTPVSDVPVPAEGVGVPDHVDTIMPVDMAVTSAAGNIDEVIDAMTLEDLLPDIHINGVSRNLLEPEACFVDKNETGYPTMMVLTAINMDNPGNIQSACITTNSDGMYMAKKSLYLYQSDWHNDKAATEIHKFALTENGSAYRASGTVDGTPSVQNFSLSEHNDILRVITTTGNWSDVSHRLFTLQETAGELKTLATLPNTAQPELIGKPDERIQSVRFVADKVYVVTFLQQDPLYVIDVADAANPFIAGQVEIPGFSSLLQPLGDNVLLGFGFEEGQFKVELYDVSDPEKPASTGKILFPGSSEAIWNYKAVSLLSDETTGAVRMAVPYSEWNDSSSRHGAQMFMVNTADMSLQNAGLMTVNDVGQPYFYPYSPRILLLNDAVHFSTGIDVWSGIFAMNAEGVRQ